MVLMSQRKPLEIQKIPTEAPTETLLIEVYRKGLPLEYL